MKVIKAIVSFLATYLILTAVLLAWLFAPLFKKT